MKDGPDLYYIGPENLAVWWYAFQLPNQIRHNFYRVHICMAILYHSAKFKSANTVVWGQIYRQYFQLYGILCCHPGWKGSHNRIVFKRKLIHDMPSVCTHYCVVPAQNCSFPVSLTITSTQSYFEPAHYQSFGY